MRFGADYDLMLKVQRRLEEQLVRPMKPAEAAKLSQSIILVVAYKRELRGVPRLKATDIIATLKRPRAGNARAIAQPVEIDAELVANKESLNSQTVTAPPPPDAPLLGK
jgi:hypothetical protein